MKQLTRKYALYAEMRQKSKLRRAVVRVLACFVVVCTVCALILPAFTLEGGADRVQGDEPYVKAVKVSNITDGTGPFDDDDEKGNDSAPDNKRIRTFDDLTVNFEVEMLSYIKNESGEMTIGGTFSEAMIKLWFLLPATESEAAFDLSAMKWMEDSGDYAPQINQNVEATFGDKTVKCQELICYKRLTPSEDGGVVIPGTFGENVTIKVKGMKNLSTLSLMLKAAAVGYEGSDGNGGCTNHGGSDIVACTTDKITVTAAPKYNVQIGGEEFYKDTFDFNSGYWNVDKNLGPIHQKDVGNVTGRLLGLGITIQLYNDNASKGLKGIELPNGDDIHVRFTVKSEYRINIPKEGSGYNQGDVIKCKELHDAGYRPLLYTFGENNWEPLGSDFRELKYSTNVTYYAPGGKCSQPNSCQAKSDHCFNSGIWRIVQSEAEQNPVFDIWISGYEIDTDHLPTRNLSGGDIYGANVGCFAAGRAFIVLPFNKLHSETPDTEDYDIVQQYGTGYFSTEVKAGTLGITSLSGEKIQDAWLTDPWQTDPAAQTANKDYNKSQMKKDDDRFTRTVELTLPGTMSNLVAYRGPDENGNCVSNSMGNDQGVGVNNTRDGRDYAAPGTKLFLQGGIQYNPNNEPKNELKYGTNLMKFYAEALELGGDPAQLVSPKKTDGIELTALYAAKKDGKDWASDYELLHTYEDDLEFYETLGELTAQGKKCVGVLYVFRFTDQSYNGSATYKAAVGATVREDMNMCGKTYMLASTTRVWTKEMLKKDTPEGEKDEYLSPQELPSWTDKNTKLASFPPGFIVSGNVDGKDQVYYTKETYAEDGSGPLGTHNSDWEHWGDTLLIISYEGRITKNIARKTGSEEKTTYNLDNKQRTVDFVLAPRVIFSNAASSGSGTTANVTIYDTLPKYLTFKPGSAYFGGEYVQPPANAGAGGTVTGGKLTPPEVTPNPDGTTTLKWIFENIPVGASMDKIYYSAEIGSENPDEDVPVGTTNILNKVRISVTHDLREPSVANGNYAEAGIAVVRGFASAYGKYARQRVVEPDGHIDWVVYYNNNASVSADVFMLDIMPADGYNRSRFSGSYTVSGFKINPENCDIKSLELYYTTDEISPENFSDRDQAKEVIRTWQKATLADDGTAAELVGIRSTAWAVLGSLRQGGSVTADLSVQLIPDTSAAAGEFDVSAFMNLYQNSTPVTTETYAVRRALSGLVWLDTDADGVRDDVEQVQNGVMVTLWRLKEGKDPKIFDADNYAPVCFPGSDIPLSVETGQQISVKAAAGKAPLEYETGKYRFFDLDAGTYAVKFENGSGTFRLTPLIASPADRGDDSFDSDASAIWNSEHSELQYTYIAGIVMPQAKDMSVALYESRFHDSGFYDRGIEMPKTGGGGTHRIIISGF
ncbi:MAG: hypothetical protein ACI4IV_07500, partial [Acutalibacteraceae bacterium]